MKNNRETKNKKGIVPAILLVVMVLASTFAFAQSGGSKLLYKGMYTQSNQIYNGTTIPPFATSAFEVKIFEDKMEYWGQPLKFKGLNNGKRIYENGNTTAYVDNNFNIFCVDEIPGFSHTEWRFIKGESTMPQSGNYGGGGTGTYTGGTTGSTSGTSGNSVQPHQITEDCPICHGSGKCNTCDGKHWYWNTYTGNKTTCPNCKPDGRCTHCGGSGKVTKTKYY